MIGNVYFACFLSRICKILQAYHDRISLRYNRKIHPVVFHNSVAVIGPKYVPVMHPCPCPYMRYAQLILCDVNYLRALAPDAVTHYNNAPYKPMKFQVDDQKSRAI